MRRVSNQPQTRKPEAADLRKAFEAIPEGVRNLIREPLLGFYETVLGGKKGFLYGELEKLWSLAGKVESSERVATVSFTILLFNASFLEILKFLAPFKESRLSFERVYEERKSL